MNDKPESTDFGELKSSATLNNVSKFSLISAFFWRPIGESTPFLRITPNSNSLVAYYDIKTKKDRVNFVRSLQLQNGGIKAAVSMTNGDRFIYTYRAAGDGWKNALVDSKSTDEFFILVRKEIDYR